MSRTTPDTPRRVLVTGSRGKSTIVRFLHAALRDAGLETYARITGVRPRQLGPGADQAITRFAGAHVEEMRWWLRGLPDTVEVVVMENSAITPDLQALAGHWLRPEMTVLSNVLPDHQEVWGPSSACAAEVLVAGIPKEGLVILPVELNSDRYLMELLERRRCEIDFIEPFSDSSSDYQATNMGLALAVVERLGLETAPALESIHDLRPDRYDFRIVEYGEAELAMAFSANDIASTRALFQSLSWSEDETCLIYNHRKDRPGRFRSFLDWLNNSRWREVLIIGDKPPMRHCSGRYLRAKNVDEVLSLFHPGERIFGCGNIAGLPLALADGLDP